MKVKEKFFKPSWISVAVLQEPVISNDKVIKGVLISNQVDPVVGMYPELKKLFYIIERHGWHGANEATLADIAMIDDLTTWQHAKENAPETILLDIGPPDFVDHDAFFPQNNEPEYDVIQIACWSTRKRIELLIEAAAKLPQYKFVLFGHFENSGSSEEFKYRNKCIELARRIAPNISFPYADIYSNRDLQNSKEEINNWINKAKIGLLSARSEGINRFKLECLSADRPFLVANDVAMPTSKHINEQTGQLFAPDANALALAITNTIENIDKFSPRDYVINNTGKTITIDKVKAALHTLCERNHTQYNYDNITWDGRNASLRWGDGAIDLLTTHIKQYQESLNQTSLTPLAADVAV